MLYIYCQYCITMVIYMSQKGLMQAGGVFHCPSGLSCWCLNWKREHDDLRVVVSKIFKLLVAIRGMKQVLLLYGYMFTALK